MLAQNGRSVLIVAILMIFSFAMGSRSWSESEDTELTPREDSLASARIVARPPGGAELSNAPESNDDQRDAAVFGEEASRDSGQAKRIGLDATAASSSSEQTAKDGEEAAETVTVKSPETFEPTSSMAPYCNLSALPFPLYSTVLSFNGPWVRQEHKPVSFRLLLHPPQTDIWLSQSAANANGDGDKAFEPTHRREGYDILLPAKSTGRPTPHDPLVLDIGANIGFHALFYASLGFRVHAFEPLKRNFEILRCSAAANNFDNLRANNFGLGKEEQVQCMRVDANNQGSAEIAPGATNSCDAEHKIATKSLDSYWEEVLDREEPFLMKMDIQSHEPFAVQGAKEMFSKTPPLFFFMEFEHKNIARHGIDPLAFAVSILDYGYSWRQVIGGDALATGGSIDLNTLKTGNESIAEIMRTSENPDLLFVHVETFKKYVAGTSKWGAG